MKIGVVGCGALGGYYGAKLKKAGRETHFLLRSDYDVVKRRGLKVLSSEGNFNVRPKCAREPEEIGPCDLVLIGLKTTANGAFEKLVSPLVGNNTAILSLQNGLGSVDQLAKLFGSEKVLGGLCFVCLNRDEPGAVQHLAHGKIVMGEHSGWPQPRTHDICAMIKHAGVPCIVTDNLRRSQWEKLVWNIPFNGLGVASCVGFNAVACGRIEGKERSACLTTADLLKSQPWAALVRELMDEVIAAANAMDLELSPKLADRMIKNTMEMGAYRASTLVDFERGLPLEFDTLFQEPLRQARAAGVETPRLEKLCAVLEKVNAERVS